MFSALEGILNLLRYQHLSASEHKILEDAINIARRRDEGWHLAEQRQTEIARLNAEKAGGREELNEAELRAGV